MSTDEPATDGLEALRRRVAELEAAVRERDARLKQVHHRVKNDLQVVCSLLHLQATQLPDPAARAALRTSEDRVRCVALVHEAAHRSADPGRIDLARHLDGLCAQLARTHRADRVRLTVRAAAADL